MSLTCSRCSRSKPDDDFKWRASVGRRDNLCKPCRKAYMREHYEANRDRYVERARRRRKEVVNERAAFITGYVRERGCADCGERDPVVLEFDHVGEKNFTIGSVLKTESWERILQAIEACEVRCANCHRRQTAKRGRHLRYLLGQESG